MCLRLSCASQIHVQHAEPAIAGMTQHAIMGLCIAVLFRQPVLLRQPVLGL